MALCVIREYEKLSYIPLYVPAGLSGGEDFIRLESVSLQMQIHNGESWPLERIR